MDQLDFRLRSPKMQLLYGGAPYVPLGVAELRPSVAIVLLVDAETQAHYSIFHLTLSQEYLWINHQQRLTLPERASTGLGRSCFGFCLFEQIRRA